MILTFLLIGQLFSFSQDSLPPPREYHCHKTESPIKVDGALKEKAWEIAPFSEAFVDIRGEGPAPKYETRVKMLWDKDMLYIGAVLEEPDVTASLKERDAIIWKDNDFEVFLDPDSDGRNYFEFEINAFGTMMDLLMDKPYSEGGNFFLPWDCRGLRYAVKVDGKINREGTDKGWSVEIAIPFASLAVGFQNPSELSPWRINFSRVEWLTPDGPEENWVWNPTGKVDMHLPSRWGLLYLVE